MFKNKKDKFAVLLMEITDNMTDAVDYFNDFKVKNVSDLKIFANTMKDYEHKADNIVHKMNKELNHTFITPIDREDLWDLITGLDEIVDGLEHCSGLREMFSLEQHNEYELKFVDEIVAAVHLVKKAVKDLVEKKLDDVTEKAIIIKDHESKCDNLYRQAMKELFNTEKDPVMIMKHKEIYQNLELISDECQTVAHVLDQIVMKNV